MSGAATPARLSVLLALALACALAAHEASTQPDWSLVGVYVYWISRIGLAFLIVIGAYTALDQVMSEDSSPIAHAGLATALSFPPFIMTVTTMDLILGDPTLIRTSPDVFLNAIGLEAAALIDNHVTVSAILLTPYVLTALRRAAGEPTPAARPARPAPRPAQEPRKTVEVEAEAAAPQEPEATPEEPEAEKEEAPEAPGLILACQPPMKGDILAAEAQEHYVRIKATEQGGMALYRFGDAVRDLNRYRGMQIHRSHWVADRAVAAIIGRRGSMKLELKDGQIVPVSRRYEIEAEARYGMLPRKPG